jgi:hypothetical protein
MDSDIGELAADPLALAHERRFFVQECPLLAMVALDVLGAIRAALCGIYANVAQPLANLVEAFGDFVFAFAQSRNLIAPSHLDNVARRMGLV